MHHQMQLSFQSETVRDSVLARVDSRSISFQAGQSITSSFDYCTLLDQLEATGVAVDEAQCSRMVTSVSMLDSSGLYKLYCKLNENTNRYVPFCVGGGRSPLRV